MAIRVDLTGKTFGDLTVKSLSSRENGQTKWLCLCACGQTVVVLHGNLQSGRTKSCGCGRIDAVTTHGMSKTPEYSAWYGMLYRCRDKKVPSHGGRGITVDERWDVFENFLEDMGPCPPGLTIERVDNDGPYTKSNCIWAPWDVQANNRSFHKRRGLKKRYAPAKAVPGSEPGDISDINWFGEWENEDT